jgi:RNA polymerase sigma factor (sigma-70 family)
MMPEPPDPSDPPHGFEDCYRTEMPRLVFFAMRLGADLNEAWDVAQQAFVNAYQHWEDVRWPPAYLRKIAQREYAQHCRDRHRESPMPQVPELADRLDPEVAKVEFQDEEARIMRMIQRLPLQQRQALAWTMDGFTPAEISMQMGTSPGTVRGNLYKARQSLQQQLNRQNGGDLNA